MAVLAGQYGNGGQAKNFLVMLSRTVEKPIYFQGNKIA